MNDPELKAMAAVYEALNGLDATTRQRVADWVLAKLSSTSGAAAKPKGAKRGRKAGIAKTAKATGAKRGRKPGSKKSVAAAKAVEPKAEAKPAKKAGKRGRPAGTAKKATKKAATKKAATKKSAGKRGRPKKAVSAAV